MHPLKFAGPWIITFCLGFIAWSIATDLALNAYLALIRWLCRAAAWINHRTGESS
jgi:hypothetical protein